MSRLARLEIKLNCQEALSYQMSSLFHGVLMEYIPCEYVSFLHQSRLHPYAQHLEYREQKWYWVINALTQDAAETIFNTILLETDSINIQKRGLTIPVESRNLYEYSYEKLAGQFYHTESDRYVQLHFITPTAFKQQGRYVFYPDIRCIYQSLMNKYDSAVSDECLYDEETLNELCANSEIKHYDLKSTRFHLEGVRIPSFIGKITVRLRGTQTMANFANLLFQFGTYSGIGIKTALGMGAIRIMKKRGKECDREAD